ncbi:hypothetical protein [Herbiconiux sp.]|uniref:hypothetical protein n=1 Tax=Herbiconiux sp. TaxID=1871186 RepID=UPI0025C466D7|nr:hypothetical protein [Herbiconiux sp.]
MKTRNLAVLVSVTVTLGCALTGCVADAPSDDAVPSVTATPVAEDEPSPAVTDVVDDPPLVDTGVREHATGQVVLDDAGQIVKYVVAEGDRGDEIGLRLGTEATQIYHDAGEFEGRNILNWGQIHPGDVLRFISGR